MVYRFVKKEGMVQRIGAIDCESLEVVLQEWLNGGAELATAEEHDAQIMGPLNKRIEELEAEKLPKSDAPAE